MIELRIPIDSDVHRRLLEWCHHEAARRGVRRVTQRTAIAEAITYYLEQVEPEAKPQGVTP